MTPERVAQVRASWARLEPQRSDLSRQFYQRLFELDPGLRALFRAVDLEAQVAVFATKVTGLLATLDATEQLVADAAALGRRHVGYGVTDRHYDLLGEALLAALRSGHGDEWTTDLEEAWRETYTLLASIMKRAARRSSDHHVVPAEST